MSHPALSLDRTTYTFISPDTPGQRYAAVQNTSLETHAGEFVSMVGSTGRGKSILPNLAVGLLQPSSEQVRVSGEPPVGINRRAGYMPQAGAPMPWRNALDNVAAGLEFQDMLDKEACDLAMSWLACVGLAGFEDRCPHQPSGGMRKHVNLAQTLVFDPDTILMNEPFSVLDIQTRQLIENEVLDLWATKRKTVLFIVHDLDETVVMNNHVVVLAAGPDTYPIGEFTIDFPHPCDVAETCDQVGFTDLRLRIWDVLREEVPEGYAQHRCVA